MKQFIKLSLLTFALLGLSVLVPVSASANLPAPDTGTGSSQTTKQARACYNKYNGHGTGRGTDGKFNKKLSDAYKKSKCDVDKGGNCSINDSSQGAIVNCKKPKSTSGGTADCSGDCSAEEITDPAIDCSSDDCDVIAKYLNPLINLLSVLVGIAIVIGIIIGGIQVSTSAGDPQKAANGKNHIRNALIALVTYILLFLILNWLIPGGSLR